MSDALLKVVVSDDEGNAFEQDVKSRSILQWEKRYPGRSVTQLETKFSYVYEVVYVAAVKNLPAGLSFDQFCDGYDIAIIEDTASVVDADPTQSAA